MRKTIILLVLVIMAACNKTQSGISNYDFKQGVNGLDMSFIRNIPPVMEGGNFRIAVFLQNKGAYDIGPGEMSIAGFNGVWMEAEPEIIELPPIKGKSIEAPDGGVFIAEFKGLNRVMPPGLEAYKSPFFVQTRYGYTTIMETNVCINPEIIELSAEACKATSSISLSGQGAPLVITKIEQNIIPDEKKSLVEVILTIQNKGGGELVSSIAIDEVMLGTRKMRCEPNWLDQLEFSQGRNKVRCTLFEARTVPYETTLSAKITYDYLTRLKGEIKVIKK